MSGFWKGWIGSPGKPHSGKPTLNNISTLPSSTKPPLVSTAINVNTHLQHASAQTKADIQEIINKHQAAALLEANNKLRELQEEREDHLEQIKAQAKMILDLKECLQLQQKKEEENSEKLSGDTNHQVENLRRQLREKDKIIERLTRQQKSTTEPINDTETVTSIHILTEKVKEQQAEIDRLQSVLQEIETFHSTHSEPEEEIIRPTSSLSPINEAHSRSVTDEDDEEEDTAEEEEELPSFGISALSQIESTSNHQDPHTKRYPQQMTLSGNQLVLLISSMPANNTVKANQKRLEIILQGLHLSPEEVQVLDGCDSSSITLRNDLFAISGQHAKYPQLFLVNFQQNDISFVGDYHTVMDLHDRNLLETSIGLTALHSEA